MKIRKKQDLIIYGILAGICFLTLILFAILLPDVPTYRLTEQPVEVKEENKVLFEDENPIVVIDPGHGGYDNGSSSADGSVVEKELVLEMSKRIQTLLEEKGVKVVMTRSSDEVSWPDSNVKDLQARLDIATNAGADMMVSIHCNISDEDIYNVSGSEVYASSKQPNSMALAENIVKALDELDDELPSRGIRQGVLHLLTYNTVPTVIVEMAFLSNPDDVAFIKNEEKQEVMCQAIVEGIVNNLQN